MKSDARVRYTKMRIREAFLQCLREKAVNRITVKEICEIAEINRATFYTHYSDPFDLMDKLEEETLEGLRKYIARHREADESVLLGILREIEQPHSKRGILASSNADPGFGAKISELLYTQFLPAVAEQVPDATEEEQRSLYRFITGGCGSVVAAWMDRETEEPAELIAERITQLCDAFIQAYRQHCHTAQNNP